MKAMRLPDLELLMSIAAALGPHLKIPQPAQ